MTKPKVTRSTVQSPRPTRGATMNALTTPWNLGTFYGGPADGLPVEIIGAFQPSRIAHGSWPGGEYRWDGRRYAWVQG